MKKCMLLISLIFFSLLGKGQEEDIIPPSPDAFNFSQYGNIQIQNNSGGFTYNLPLYSIKEDNVEIPISLNYYTSGIRIDEISTSVGLGWNLGGIGVISRTVRDLPDEMAYKIFRPNLENLENHIVGIQEAVNNPSIDTEQDWFNFSFGNYSGQFYLDENLNIHISTPEIKISKKVITYSLNEKYWEFELIDPTGTKYIFGGSKNSVEETLMRSNCKSFDLRTETAWYLRRIITTKNKIINFKYQEFHSLYTSSISEQVVYREKNSTDILNGPTALFLETEKFCISQTDLNGIIINEISTDNMKAIFELSAERKDMYNSFLIKELTIYNNENDIIKNIKLDYDEIISNSGHSQINNSDINYRYYLKEVNYDNDKIFHFDYESPQYLPRRLTYSKDYSGFYNAQKNVRLIPSPGNALDFLISNAANRSVNPQYYGCLKKITYPTKGYTEINYEPNKTIVKETKKVFKNQSINTVLNRCEEEDQRQRKRVEESAPFVINDSQIDFYTSGGAYVCEDVDIEPSQAGSYRFILYNITKNTPVKSFGGYPGSIFTSKKEQCPYPHKESEACENNTGCWKCPIAVDSGDMYKVLLEVYAKPYGDVSAYVGISYDSEDIEFEESKNYPGLRISSLHDYDGVGNKQERNFYYNSLEQYPSNYSSIVLPTNKHDYLIEGSYFPKCGDAFPCPWRFKILSFYDSPLNSLYPYRKSNVIYTNITEFKNDGAVEYSYNFAPNSPPSNILGNNVHGTPFTNDKDWINGFRNNIKHFKKLGNSFKLVKEEFRNPFELYSIPFENYKFYKEFTEYFMGSKIDELRNISISYYLNYLYSTKENKIITQTYDLNGNHPITTQTDYQYNNPAHQQVTKTTVSNSKGEVIETSYQYAHEKNNTRLINENRISIPLQTTVTKGGTIVSDQLTQYATFGNLYLPQYIFSKKGATTSSTATDRKLSYDRYDAKGNLLQYHTEDGLYTSILWGYNGQYPIAKVEGATYDQISGYASNPNGLRTALPGAMITTYTYEPLVGVTSITAPNGQTQTFTYDAFNRLYQVKDHTGKILKEYQYHYQTQNN